MSVTVSRQAPVHQPVERIVVRDSADDTLSFASRGVLSLLGPYLHATVRTTAVRVRPADARELGAALVEWADAVEA